MNPMLRYDLCSTCNGSCLKTADSVIQILSPKTDDTIFSNAVIQRVSHRTIAAVAF